MRGPAWIGKKMVNTENVSYYDGDPQMMERHLLQASFYFISSETMVHQKILYTFQDLIAEIGGIAVVLYNVSGEIAY